MYPKKGRRKPPEAARIVAAPGLRDAVIADFKAHGAAAIAQLREADPIAYLKLCADLSDGVDADAMDDGALVAHVRSLLAQLGALSGAGDG
ncbi:MAG: hypothetical protein AAF684_03300 [Pseudomonadota bacterium]